MEFELANQIYVFSPDCKKGIMFYDHSPSSDVAKFSGSLPEGKFWSSGEEIVEWNEEINGSKIDNIPVNSQVSLLINSQKVRVYDGDSFASSTIIVSHENFLKLLKQIEHPVMESNQQYNILDFNSIIYDYDNFKNLNYLNDFTEINNKNSNSKR